jgi:hypothetical protein
MMHLSQADDVPSEYRPYLLILRALRYGHLTIRQIEIGTGITYGALRHMVRNLRASKLIGVKRWTRVGRGWLPVYGLGVDEADEVPAMSKPMVACISLAVMLKALSKPTTAHELAEESGVGHGSVLRFLRVCKALRMAYVAEWHPMGGAYKPTAHWKLGSKPDAPRPAPVPRPEIAARYNAKVSARRQHLQLVHALAGTRTLEAA